MNTPGAGILAVMPLHAISDVHGEEGLLMAPAYAVPRLLARQGLTLGDLDYVEIHEAFAATVLSHLAAWEDKEFCVERLGLDDALGTVGDQSVDDIEVRRP